LREGEKRKEKENEEKACHSMNLRRINAKKNGNINRIFVNGSLTTGRDGLYDESLRTELDDGYWMVDIGWWILDGRYWMRFEWLK
jgi:hypothetical protein